MVTGEIKLDFNKPSVGSKDHRRVCRQLTARKTLREAKLWEESSPPVWLSQAEAPFPAPTIDPPNHTTAPVIPRTTTAGGRGGGDAG